jgi:hypothetical protein
MISYIICYIFNFSIHSVVNEGTLPRSLIVVVGKDLIFLYIYIPIYFIYLNKIYLNI